MSDLHAAYQSAKNGDLLDRLTAIAESQTKIIERQETIIRNLQRDVRYLKSKSDVHTSQIIALTDATDTALEVTKMSDLNFKAIVTGFGVVKTTKAAEILGITHTVLEDRIKDGTYKGFKQGKFWYIWTHSLKQSGLEQMVEDGWDILGVGKMSGKKIPQHKRKEYFRGVVEFNSQGEFIGKHKDYVKILTDSYNENR